MYKPASPEKKAAWPASEIRKLAMEGAMDGLKRMDKGTAGRMDADRREGSRLFAAFSFFWRSCGLAVFLSILALFPCVSPLQDSYRVVLWLSPATLMEAQAEPVIAEKNIDFDRDSARLAKKIRTLLVPVYGEDHVVVQVHCGDAEAGGSDGRNRKSGRTVAIIIDAAVLSGLNGSAEGIRAEQERLCNLVSHAAGLKGPDGDSIAVSFILFQNDESRMLLYVTAAGCAVLILAALAWAVRKRGNRGRDSHLFDADAVSGRKMTDMDRNDRKLTREESLAMKLQAESPQAGGLVLAMLDARSAAAVLACLPKEQCVNFLCAMFGQGPVRKEVLDIIKKEYLARFPAEKGLMMRIAQSGSGDAEKRIGEILRRLDAPSRRAILKGLSAQCPDLADRL